MGRSANSRDELGFRETVRYVDKGKGSWKEQALGTTEDVISNPHKPLAFPATFHGSDWKHFHDALQAHRFYVLNELLPAYGILST
jgi:hypothetical protein